MVHLLPEALQPFYREDTRQCLPFRKSDMDLYDELSQLLTTTAGHPRRLEVLFRELGKFKASQPAAAVLWASDTDTGMSQSERRAAGRLFVDELAKWLHNTHYRRTIIARISKKVVHIVRLPTDYSIFINSLPSEQHSDLTYKEKDEHIGAAIEDLATYCAKPFIMPGTKDERDWMRIVLFGISHGFCQLVSMNDRNEEELLAFIPMPVLEGSRPRELQPRGEALFALRDAILGMYKNKRGNPNEQGKDFEKVAVASLLLMARCRDTFTLGQLCETGSSGAGLDVEMRGGSSVTVTTVDKFPEHQDKAITAADVQTFINKLKSTNAPGIIITVNDPMNIPSDFYGIFETESGGFAGFRVQCKDWFKDTVYNNKVPVDIVEKWRQHDNMLPSQKVVLEDGTTVPFASLLFVANRLQQKVTLNPFEGVISIAAMRTWLPTAAHALQTFSHLREIFGWHNEVEDSE